MRAARWPAGWGHVPAVPAWQVGEAKGIITCARVLEKGTGRPLCHDPGRSGAMSRESDLNVLIRTGLTSPIAIGLVKPVRMRTFRSLSRDIAPLLPGSWQRGLPVPFFEYPSTCHYAFGFSHLPSGYRWHMTPSRWPPGNAHRFRPASQLAAWRARLLCARPHSAACCTLVSTDPEPMKVVALPVRDGTVGAANIGRPDFAFLLERH